MQKSNKANAPSEPCGRQKRSFCFSPASSQISLSTNTCLTIPGSQSDSFLRQSPCYAPQLPWIRQAVQPQCQELCGHPTSLGSAHTVLTDCPRTKKNEIHQSPSSVWWLLSLLLNWTFVLFCLHLPWAVIVSWAETSQLHHQLYNLLSN